MKTISLDLRERILAVYDTAEATREEVGRRFRVSVGMVKKLLQQRKKTGDIAPRHHRSGRKPLLLASHRERLRSLLSKKPDLTLAELRAGLAIECSLPAIHYVLVDLGMTYKKRRCVQPSRTGRTSPGHAGAGSGSKAALTPRGLSSSTNRPPKRT
jgi:transposase